MIKKNVFVVTYDARCSNKTLDDTQKYLGVFGTLAQAMEFMDEQVREIAGRKGGPYPVQMGSNELCVVWKSVVHPILLDDTMEETFYVKKEVIKII